METAKPSDVFQQAKVLVANDHLRKACDLLQSEDALSIKGRLKDLENRNRRGILEVREYEISKNKIRDDLLNLIRRLEKPNPEVVKRNQRLFPWLIGMTILIVMAWILWSSQQEESTTSRFQPIFTPRDSSSFNVLIIRFEDYIAKEDTDCIGRAIQENLNVIQANKQLSLRLYAEYADSIAPPRTVDEAKVIQKQHHADLIIYGLAKNIQENCSGAEVCFRYNIAEQVVAQVLPAIEVKATKHDLSYLSTSPMQIENGELQIDALSLEYWITSLIKIKANEINEAFLELDKIGTDTILNDHARANRFFTIGNTYLFLRQNIRANKAYSKAIELDPNFADVYRNRGIAYATLMQYERALADYDKAIELDPNLADVYRNRGIAYADLKQYERALAEYDKAIELDPDFAEFYRNRGTVYANLKQYERALAEYDKAIELDPNLAYTYRNRGIAYADLKQYERALAEYDKAIELDPSMVYAYNNRGAVYADLKQYERAIAEFDKAIELDPNYTEAYGNRGIFYTILKQYERALAEYDKAIELDPDFADFYRNRGTVYANLKQYERAIADYDKAIELDPNYAYAYNNRGNILRRAGKLEKAKTDVKKSLSLDGDNGWAYATLAMIYADKGNMDLFFENCVIAISKPLAYPLKEQLEEEETLQKLINNSRFQKLLEESKN